MVRAALGYTCFKGLGKETRKSDVNHGSRWYHLKKRKTSTNWVVNVIIAEKKDRDYDHM